MSSAFIKRHFPRITRHPWITLVLIAGISLPIILFSPRAMCWWVSLRALNPDGNIDTVASMISRITPSPTRQEEQAAMVDRATDNLIAYDNSPYHRHYIRSLRSMWNERSAAHAARPVGDCKAKAVFAGALLTQLHIRWQPVTNPALEHLWIRVTLDNGKVFDLQKPDPRPPSTDAWIRRWQLLGYGNVLPGAPRYREPALADPIEARLYNQLGPNPPAPPPGTARFPFGAPL